MPCSRFLSTKIRVPLVYVYVDEDGDEDDYQDDYQDDYVHVYVLVLVLVE